MNFNDIQYDNYTKCLSYVLIHEVVYKYLLDKFGSSNAWDIYKCDDNMIGVLYNPYTKTTKEGIYVMFKVENTIKNIQVIYDTYEPRNQSMYNMNHLDYEFDHSIRFTPRMYNKILSIFRGIKHDLNIDFEWCFDSIIFDFTDTESFHGLSHIDKNMKCLLYDNQNALPYFLQMNRKDYKWMIQQAKLNNLPQLYIIGKYDFLKFQLNNSNHNNLGEKLNWLKLLKDCTDELRIPNNNTIIYDFKALTLYNKFRSVHSQNLHLPAMYRLYKIDFSQI